MGARVDLQSALSHKAPRRVPVDFGATAITGMHALAVERLRDHYGLEKRPVKIVDPFQMRGLIEPDLIEAMGVTVDGVLPTGNLFGFYNLGPYKPYRTLWGQDVLVPEGFRTLRGADGGEYLFPQGDTGCQPSGRMPESGYYFDAIIRQPQFDEDELDWRDNCEEFVPVDEPELAHLRREAVRLRASGLGAVAGLPMTGLGDIAWVPGTFLKSPKGIRDVEEWYISLAARKGLIHKIFEEQTRVALENLPKIWEALGDSVDAVVVCGTDLGTQTSQFCSSASFNELYRPYYRKINDWIHAHTPWKTFKHSCGAIVPLLPSLIESGFDIINPVQCSATGMNPAALKREFGRDLVFWGGGVDTQHTLPFGTPDEVRKEVLSRLETFAPGGGYVFNAIHNVQANTPVENMVAMLDAVRAFHGE